MSLPNEVSATLTLLSWREGAATGGCRALGSMASRGAGQLSSRQSLACTGSADQPIAQTPPSVASASKTTYKSLGIRSSLGKGWICSV